MTQHTVAGASDSTSSQPTRRISTGSRRQADPPSVLYWQSEPLVADAGPPPPAPADSGRGVAAVDFGNGARHEARVGLAR